MREVDRWELCAPKIVRFLFFERFQVHAATNIAVFLEKCLVQGLKSHMLVVLCNPQFLEWDQFVANKPKLKVYGLYIVYRGYLFILSSFDAAQLFYCNFSSSSSSQKKHPKQDTSVYGGIFYHEQFICTT